MKKYFTTCVFLFSIAIFSQEAGKAGELLKNEAGKSEMQTQKKESSTKKQNTNNSGFRNPQNQNPNDSYQNNSNRNPDYRWNQNFGYSEVFLRIPEQGYFTVEVGDQMMSNASGKYRFFELASGRIPISIYENGYLLFRTTIQIQNNSRMVLDFFTNYGLYLLDTYPVRNQNYGINDWNDIWNNPYGNQGQQPGNNNYYGNVMNDGAFVQFLNILKRNANFDEDKMNLVTQQSRNSSFTSEQVRVLLKALSFDKNRLTLAKSLYSKCVDKNNYFVVYDAFDFDANKKELMKFISNG
mgnify:FL=1